MAVLISAKFANSLDCGIPSTVKLNYSFDVALLSASLAYAHATLRLNPIMASAMVLPTSTSVWGTAAAASTVQIQVSDNIFMFLFTISFLIAKLELTNPRVL